MTDSQHQPALEFSPAPQQSRRRTHWLFYGLAVLGLLIVVGGVIGVGSLLWYSQSNFTPALEQFLAAAENREYERAWAMAAPEMRSQMDLNLFRRTYDGLNKTLGRHTSLTPYSFKVVAQSRGTFATGAFWARFERGSATLAVTFKKDRDAWRVVSVKYENVQISQPVGRRS